MLLCNISNWHLSNLYQRSTHLHSHKLANLQNTHKQINTNTGTSTTVSLRFDISVTSNTLMISCHCCFSYILSLWSGKHIISFARITTYFKYEEKTHAVITYIFLDAKHVEKKDSRRGETRNVKEGQVYTRMHRSTCALEYILWGFLSETRASKKKGKRSCLM